MAMCTKDYKKFYTKCGFNVAPNMFKSIGQVKFDIMMLFKEAILIAKRWNDKNYGWLWKQKEIKSKDGKFKLNKQKLHATNSPLNYNNNNSSISNKNIVVVVLKIP